MGPSIRDVIILGRNGKEKGRERVWPTPRGVGQIGAYHENSRRLSYIFSIFGMGERVKSKILFADVIFDKTFKHIKNHFQEGGSK